jgi:exoribonuclease II
MVEKIAAQASEKVHTGKANINIFAKAAEYDRKQDAKRVLKKHRLSELAFCHSREGGNLASTHGFCQIFGVLRMIMSFFLDTRLRGYDSHIHTNLDNL